MLRPFNDAAAIVDQRLQRRKVEWCGNCSLCGQRFASVVLMETVELLQAANPKGLLLTNPSLSGEAANHRRSTKQWSTDIIEASLDHFNGFERLNIIHTGLCKLVACSLRNQVTARMLEVFGIKFAQGGCLSDF